MANLLRKAASNLLNKMGNPAHVLAVRAWEARALYELDLYLPTTDLAGWTTIQRLACRVDEFTFRDYSPATWDALRQTCTLYIEAGHAGAGSRWVKQLRPGDTVTVRATHAEKLPAGPGLVLALGDGSALGHLLALQQLTCGPENPLNACVAFHGNYQIPDALQVRNPAFALLPATSPVTTLARWMHEQPLSSYSAIYLAGNMKLVADLRRQLRAQPQVAARLYATGFWQ